ncbi:MAG: ATP-binding cassette domain-containing protein [Chloroflexota bacterium]|nr:ATP-binding cassette domain-containing protein [Chloroflexota bacterium]
MKSNSAPAVEAWGLVKSFGKTRAVEGVDLHVKSGRVYGFLGPNGAGKTTTIRMLATLLRPDEGKAKVFGYDVAKQANEVRQRVSLTGQFASLDEDLTGYENLVLLARLRGYSWSQASKRANDLLGFFELEEAAKRLIKTYSGGMRRRADIAASLVTTPELLFLDEPTTGLDPRNRNQIWDIIRELVADNITVFLTTQYLDEADALAERMAVIDNGRIIAEGTGGELKSKVGRGALHLRFEDSKKRQEAEEFLSQRLDIPVHLDSDPAELTARLSSPEDATKVLQGIAQVGVIVDSFSFGQPSLDEVFLTLTGHAAETLSEEDKK